MSMNQQTENPASKAASTAENVAEQVKQEGARLASRVKDGIEQMAEERKQLAADYLDDMSSAIAASSKQMREQGHPSAAAVADQAAERVTAVAKSVSDTSPAELLHEAESFARSQPVLFYGAALVLGFGLSRFLKSSARAETVGREMPS